MSIIGRIKGFLEAISANRQQPAICPPQLNDDPVAQKTDWTPLQKGGVNFCKYKLAEITPYRVEFRSTLSAILFCMVFLVLGTGLLTGIAIAISMTHDKKLLAALGAIGPLAIGLVFASIGGYMLYLQTKPIVFDHMTGYFWKGRQEPRLIINPNIDSIKSCIKLEQVYAIQLICEYCRGNKSSFYSYELNLVLSNGKRVNAVDHGNIKQLRGDADKLSVFLGKPVWDFIPR